MLAFIARHESAWFMSPFHVATPRLIFHNKEATLRYAYSLLAMMPTQQPS